MLGTEEHQLLGRSYKRSAGASIPRLGLNPSSSVSLHVSGPSFLRHGSWRFMDPSGYSWAPSLVGFFWLGFQGFSDKSALTLAITDGGPPAITDGGPLAITDGGPPAITHS